MSKMALLFVLVLSPSYVVKLEPIFQASLPQEQREPASVASQTGAPVISSSVNIPKLSGELTRTEVVSRLREFPNVSKRKISEQNARLALENYIKALGLGEDKVYQSEEQLAKLCLQGYPRACRMAFDKAHDNAEGLVYLSAACVGGLRESCDFAMGVSNDPSFLNEARDLCTDGRFDICNALGRVSAGQLAKRMDAEGSRCPFEHELCTPSEVVQFQEALSGTVNACENLELKACGTLMIDPLVPAAAIEADAVLSRACDQGIVRDDIFDSEDPCNQLAKLLRDSDPQRALALAQKSCDGGEHGGCTNAAWLDVKKFNNREAAYQSFAQSCQGTRPYGDEACAFIQANLNFSAENWAQFLKKPNGWFGENGPVTWLDSLVEH